MGHHAREPARRGVAVIIDLNGHLKVLNRKFVVLDVLVDQASLDPYRWVVLRLFVLEHLSLNEFHHYRQLLQGLMEVVDLLEHQGRVEPALSVVLILVERLEVTFD